MGHLDKLKVSKRIIAAARSRHKMETTEYRRQKLIAHVEEQIELAQLALDDEPRQLQRKRGHQVVSVRPRLWWKAVSDGSVLTQIRYNNVPLNLGGRGTTIEVGPLRQLPTTYRIVIKAIKAGELDTAIEVAIKKSRR